MPLFWRPADWSKIISFCARNLLLMRLPAWKRKSMSTQAIAQQEQERVEDTTRHETFLHLIGQYEAALRRLAAGYVARDADREDLFQEIAVGLWRAIPSYRGEASERTWLYRVAHNIAISSSARLYRRQKREEAMPEAFDHISARLDSEQELLRNEKRRALVEAIRSLPALDRQIVLLHLEDLTYAEIEQISGLSQSAVATRLSRVRERLKEEMQAREMRRQ
jgi:RNA polymerase sigma-70 factor (ECF subfamily)